jgi:hypothetical protein
MVAAFDASTTATTAGKPATVPAQDADSKQLRDECFRNAINSSAQQYVNRSSSVNSSPDLKLIDRGVLSASTRGSMHGEIGQTQFLPKNILAYGTGNLHVAANALNSTANFLKAHGWRSGAGYQPGRSQFRSDPGMERRSGPRRHRVGPRPRAVLASDRRSGSRYISRAQIALIG